eukprot:scaffold4483_cov29-Prasinocladus_malaysianus.AAC.1
MSSLAGSASAAGIIRARYTIFSVKSCVAQLEPPGLADGCEHTLGRESKKNDTIRPPSELPSRPISPTTYGIEGLRASALIS